MLPVMVPFAPLLTRGQGWLAASHAYKVLCALVSLRHEDKETAESWKLLDRRCVRADGPNTVGLDDAGGLFQL